MSLEGKFVSTFYTTENVDLATPNGPLERIIIKKPPQIKQRKTATKLHKTKKMTKFGPPCFWCQRIVNMNSSHTDVYSEIRGSLMVHWECSSAAQDFLDNEFNDQDE